MGPVVYTGVVGLKEAHLFLIPSRTQQWTLELNSRERTWREWISFCPKCKGSPSSGGLGYV